MINSRNKMRRSHQKAIQFLLENGFNFVYIIQHNRYDTFTYLKNQKIRSKDILGVADGIAVRNSVVYFIQVKSNSFDGFKKFEKMLSTFGLNGLFLNVRDYKDIVVREVNIRGSFRW